MISLSLNFSALSCLTWQKTLENQAYYEVLLYLELTVMNVHESSKKDDMLCLSFYYEMPDISKAVMYFSIQIFVKFSEACSN